MCRAVVERVNALDVSDWPGDEMADLVGLWDEVSGRRRQGQWVVMS